jgi:phosphoribosylanthranilate isomerase
MIVQVYEIQSPMEAEKCIGLGVHNVGSLLLSRDEWKNPGVKGVIDLCRESGARSSLIPLFGDLETLLRVEDYYRPDYLHLCENLTDPAGRAVSLSGIIERDQILRVRFPDIGIMRTIPVPAEGGPMRDFPSLELAGSLQAVSSVFLIDTWAGKEPVDGFIGITGRLADRKMARAIVEQSSVPVILAGGLSPKNVFDAILEIRPYGVDSCTLTNETEESGRPVRFRKDLGKVRRFVEEAKRAFAIVEYEN